MALPGKRLCPTVRLVLGRSVDPGSVAGRDLGDDQGGAVRQTFKIRARTRNGDWRGSRRGFQVLVKLHQRTRSRIFRCVSRSDENSQRIAQTIEQPYRQYLVISQREQAGTQGQQMAGEVAAVHRRDVQRWQRLQRLRVVPVVEVPPVTFQSVHRAQGVRRALDEQSGRDVAEVVSGQVRQQRQPDVGRRGAMGDCGNAILLIVVGGQPMVRGADEAVEELPRPPRQRAQEEGLGRRQLCFARHKRAADPPRENG